MYVHIGKDTIIPSKNIIAIINNISYKSCRKFFNLRPLKDSTSPNQIQLHTLVYPI